MSLKRLFCTHRTLTVKRAHPDSSMARKEKNDLAWVDTLGCFTFVSCYRCGKNFKFKVTESIFGNYK